MFVNNFFKLPVSVKEEIQSLKPNFGYGAFSEILFYRTYSRAKSDGSMESWNDVVVRVIEGCLSIRKDWYIKNHLHWNEDFWNSYCRLFALSMFDMNWLPAGRGLWAMGTDFLYERGSMCLNNCGALEISHEVGDDIHWLMDALMCGVGVGFAPLRDDDLKVYKPTEDYTYIIADTRESWCDSVKARIDCYLTRGARYPRFEYHKIRGPGELIKSFGGISSGPDPLKKLHDNIDIFFNKYLLNNRKYDSVRLKTDLANAVGCAVVAGNVRRSAEIALGYLDDPTFINLKNYNMYPERAELGWMSNNSVYLETKEDYDKLQFITERIIENGEPGVVNLKNLKHGRLGKFDDNLKKDKATLLNPCGEQPLENKELCNLAETFPTRCPNIESWFKACEYATVYASSCALLPTHRKETNAVMMRNRRIGISIADFTGWVKNIGRNKVIKHLRDGYARVRTTNKWVSEEAGVPEAVRVTTVKPGGTIPKLVGVTSGCGYPTFHETLRRFRIASNSPMVPLLIEANIPYEKDFYSDNTLVFEFPILQGPAKPAIEASLWEQANNLMLLQSEWSDNAVSNTLYFKPKWIKEREYSIPHLNPDNIYNINKEFGINIETMVEHGISFETPLRKYILDETLGLFTIYKFNEKHEEDVLNDVLSTMAPNIKSASLLPHTYEGVYVQMPEEGISKEEFNKRISVIKPIDWSRLTYNQPTPEAYCTGDKCELPVK